ncbi:MULTISPECIES: cyanophycinase [unclassified Leptolyngbya]|uniref:cyanophycinase n=1 Tax=unclassified Leptolyngbya TaxID=2650499 RepID=UPI001682F735|nr:MULTISPECIES: cyanophycinase [unclassified Leptolyngbya]MBD1911919.1 cyanophycinase [Leptolyngbya sp. FACHB-8]MBD2156128.1 cyanophycinase [Leptolyngbya sp. FACHB-16]
MDARTTKGALLIVGGAEDKEGSCTILREFTRLAGGQRARIAVMTAATSYPDEVGRTYTDVFLRLGAEAVDVVDTRDRRDSEASDLIDVIQSATGIFFTGGDQAQIIDRIKDTPLDKAIREQHASGVVVGGTSAGAAMMPDMMIVEGDSATNPRLDVVEMGPGMGFLPGVVIDQHFAQRGRLGRLLSALLIEPSILGFGIDENTAIAVQGDELTVLGEGAVTVVDESESTYNNLKTALKDEDLAVYGVKVHILPRGHQFNLKTRKPTPP